MSLGKGYIQIYTGGGKGKTTAALGLALRAVGRGLIVYCVQFLKSAPSGEVAAAERLAPQLRVFRFSSARDFFWRLDAEEKEEERGQSRAALSFARAALQGRECDILILDEVLGALDNGLFSLEEILALLNDKPEGVEIILTGRAAPPELLEKADLVTEMKEIRHYYRRGVPARNGIEK